MLTVGLMSVADFAKTAAVMARLLEVCSDSLRAAPLTAPLRLVRTLSKFASVVSFCTCVIYHGCHVHVYQCRPTAWRLTMLMELKGVQRESSAN